LNKKNIFLHCYFFDGEVDEFKESYKDFNIISVESRRKGNMDFELDVTDAIRMIQSLPIEFKGNKLKFSLGAPNKFVKND